MKSETLMNKQKLLSTSLSMKFHLIYWTAQLFKFFMCKLYIKPLRNSGGHFYFLQRISYTILLKFMHDSYRNCQAMNNFNFSVPNSIPIKVVLRSIYVCQVTSNVRLQNKSFYWQRSCNSCKYIKRLYGSIQMFHS